MEHIQTEKDMQEFMTARRSGKTCKASEKKVKAIDAATKKAMQEMQIASYFSRLRSDSPRRWLKRIMKPSELRYQSLLRGVMRIASKKVVKSCKCKESELRRTDGMPHHPMCARNRTRNEQRRIRQGRMTIDTVQSARVAVK